MGGFLIGTDPTLRKTKTPTVTTLAAGVGFTAGTSTAITLSADPTLEANVIVTMDGVTQHRSGYSISGTTLTFDAAIPTGTAEIEATFVVPDVTTLATPANDSVATAKIADNAVTLAKLAGGTDGNIISYDASGDPVAIATGSDGQVLTSTGAGSPPAFEAAGGGITLGTEVASTSGTAIEFTGIASTAKRITINMVGMSQGSASQTVQLQLSDSGGYETSGYTSVRHGVSDESTSTTTRSTAHFGLFFQTGFQAADVLDGVIVLTLEDSTNNQWMCWSILGQTNLDYLFVQVGTKPLSGELTAFKIFTGGGATFDAGACNIMVE